MSNSCHPTLFCGIIAALTLALTLLLSFAKAAGAIGAITRTLGYEAKLFDTSYVHSIDIVMDADDWQSFLDTAESEEYAICSVTIDGETVKTAPYAPRATRPFQTLSNTATTVTALR